MWLSGRKHGGAGTGAMVGATTLEGDPAGAYLDGERRQLEVFAPGGYHWRPALGQQVLVIKEEGGGSCVAGARCSAELAPGEVYIAGGGAGIWLRSNGELDLCGDVRVNGVPILELLGGGE